MDLVQGRIGAFEPAGSANVILDSQRADILNPGSLLFPREMYGHIAESSMHEPLAYFFTWAAAQVVLIETEICHTITFQ